MADKDQEVDTGLNEEDLVKGLNKLDEFVASHDETSRKEQLLQKALADNLEETERGELFQLMGGSTGDGDDTPRSEEIIKSLSDNETLQKAFEVSDFLREQHDELAKSLGTLASYQEHAEARQHEFNLVLAKTVSDSGKLIKAMSERLGVIAKQPARGPKSIRTPKDQVLHKSFGEGGDAPAGAGDGGGGDGDQLNRGKILKGLDGMMQKSMGNDEPGLADCGEDISIAVATFEQTSQISKSMLAEVREHLSGR